jgi:hypothetical protein
VAAAALGAERLPTWLRLLEVVVRHLPVPVVPGEVVDRATSAIRSQAEHDDAAAARVEIARAVAEILPDVLDGPGVLLLVEDRYQEAFTLVARDIAEWDRTGHVSLGADTVSLLAEIQRDHPGASIAPRIAERADASSARAFQRALGGGGLGI